MTKTPEILDQARQKRSQTASETYHIFKTAVSHLRARKSAMLLDEAEKQIDAVDQTPDGETVLHCASDLCRLNWSLILPFFETSQKLLTVRNLITPWSQLACELAIQ